MTNKNVRVNYYCVIKKYWSNHNDKPNVEETFRQLPELLNHIISIDEVDRKYENQKRFVFLKSFKKSSSDSNIWTGVFISARINFNPNIINRKSLKERESGKTKDDGDKEKTHFSIKIENDYAFLISEHNAHGVSLKTLQAYLNHFKSNFSDSLNENKQYSLHIDKILISGFLKELKKIKRTREIITYIDKKILGDDYLNLSNKISKVKRNLQLKIVSDDCADIKETAIDLFNSFNRGRSNEISRLRVTGYDADKNEVRLDTTIIEKKDFIDVDLNILTGEVNTPNIISTLKGLARIL